MSEREELIKLLTDCVDELSVLASYADDKDQSIGMKIRCREQQKLRNRVSAYIASLAAPQQEPRGYEGVRLGKDGQINHRTLNYSKQILSDMGYTESEISSLYTAPLSGVRADSPADAVVVPMELLRQLRHYTECHRMVFKDCGAPTQSEVDAMLRAAQEGK